MNDHQSIEILSGDEWSARPGAIAYGARFDAAALAACRGRVGITIACDAVEDRLEATIGPDRQQTASILIRREPAVRARCFAFQASKAASDLSPALRERLRAPDAEVVVTVTARGAGLAASGGLFLVGMPIGNQGDLGARALDVLTQADVIYAEDTRAAHAALAWRGVSTRIVSCHDHNEERRAAEVVRRLAAGERVVLVSDAGMPLVSDPGFRLVRAVLAADAYVTVVPGPSAVLAALALSGLPSNAFRFLGFPPRKAGERAAFLDGVLKSVETSILFEAGSRVDDLVADLAERASARQAALCRDLTKTSEAVTRGTLEAINAVRGAGDPHGEYVLVVAGDAEAPSDGAARTSLDQFVAALVAQDCPTAPIVKALRQTGAMSRAEAYAFVEHLKARSPRA